MIDDGLIPGSFRDVAGNVYEVDGRIFRTVNPCACKDFEAVRDSGVVAESIANGFLITSNNVEPGDRPATIPDTPYLIEHERIPYVSYPYEWSFSQLKAAALHHLDFQIFLFERGVTLSDAAAYNIQFYNAKPIFIDLLSLKPYSEGELWLGHRQFCEQFLNPLLIRSLVGIPHNSWYRGALEGIATADLAKIVPLRKRLSWNILSQVILQAKLDKGALRNPVRAIEKAKSTKKLSKSAYRGFLFQMRNWIAKLSPSGTANTVWGDYAHTHTYSDEEAVTKKNFIANFAKDTMPDMLIDLGCNTGEYSVAALEGGAGRVIGFDFDQHAVDIAYSRAVENKLSFLPLLLDASNPSPNQGWRQMERQGFNKRTKADAVVALAFVHHLAIAKNVPMDQVIDWIVDIAPHGVIEFVPKSDPTVQTMLALRRDIFDDYTEKSFKAHLERRATILNSQVISNSGRTMYRYHRNS